MDNLKLYARSEKEFDPRVQIVRVGKQFGIEKCSTLAMKGGSNQKESNARRQVMKSLKGGKGYKYLGLLQTDFKFQISRNFME